MKQINNLSRAVAFLAALASLSSLTSCVDYYDNSLTDVKKPDVLIQYEYLNNYDVLKKYVDRTANPEFKLGTGVSATDFNAKETMYSLAVTNFDEVVPDNAMMYGSIVADDGTMNFGTLQALVQTAQEAGIALYGHALVWHAQQNVPYLNSLLAPTVIPIETQQGTDLVADFDEVALGTTYPMTGNGAATVDEDPVGQTGNVLHITGPASYSYPIITVTLPEGRKLGIYQTVTIDFNGKGSSGLYGTGMRLAINNADRMAQYGSPANFGCPDGSWGRGAITLELSKINLTEEERNSNTFDLIIGSGTGSGDYYIDNIKMYYENTVSGTINLADFDNDAVGDTYPMSANGSGTVEPDPAGQTGNVLHIAGPAVYSYPQIPVTLPAGRKLGDLKTITMDFNGKGSSGLYGSGMRLSINDAGAAVTYGSPSSFGCPDGSWGRGAIALPVADLNLTAEQKALTSFTLIVGSGTGSGDYYIDNIKALWESDEKEIIIEQTPEEKADTLTWAMNNWMAGMMSATEGYVKAWEVVNEPMSDDNPSELKGGSTDDLFFWQDYLGKEYARTAVRLARANGGEGLKLFVNDYGLESAANDNAKCEGLIAMVKYWESDGVTRIDGIGTQMHVNYSPDPAVQHKNEAAITRMFELLAATGKLIKVSELDMGILDNSGKPVLTTNVTEQQHQEMAEYYRFIVQKYFEIIPAAQRYGITQWSAVDKKSGNTARADEPLGLWDVNYNRKHTYAGFADGLAGK
ncbi:MAG: endo-1,4-beta-xylanase [Prevotellaceae bacterium]|jgi:GH35 family endo-1,4-beta-xylanase|nr:endo-1,4-beta-xylanase [Prevotellaceae bacterium]